ncbi:MAG TPA: Holliday junction resolvase RuvX [Candidatus Krumholzibacteria bacterium]
MSVILALDPGERRTGIAISDPEGSLARPLQTHDRKRDGSLFALLRALCDEHGVARILVGHPITQAAERGQAALHAEALADRLRSQFDIDIELVDERYSSAEADHLLRGSRRPKGDRDAIAAAFILQGYLDAR